MDLENNSSIWFVIGAILLISAVVGSAAYFNNPTGQLTNPKLNLPTVVPTKQTQLIQATSCNADNMCEMNNAQVSGEVGATAIVTNTIKTSNGLLGMGIDNQGHIRFGANGDVDFGMVTARIGQPIPALTITGASTPTGQYKSEVNVNGKTTFNDFVEFTTAYADNFKARNHVSADILTVRSAMDPSNSTNVSVNAYACFDKYGNLFRSGKLCI